MIAFIKNNQIYSKPLEYILSILGKNKSCPIKFVNEKSKAQLIFDHTDSLSLPVNVEFYDSLLNKKMFNHEVYFKENPYLLFLNSKNPDWLGTAFYMINSFQEYADERNNDVLDRYGRFRYDKSYQYKFNCIEKNLVQECFDDFCEEHLILKSISKVEKKSRVFFSHDIDTIYGSFLQDGLWAIKKGRLDIVLKLIMNEILSNPHWKNIDKIVKLHSEYDLKSTFFWIATKKRSANKVKNADYSVGKLNNILKFSQSNGLHKSCYDSSFNEELKVLPFKTKLNRYHFLKFTLPSSWNEIEKSEIKFDASLGYAERYGFRNSYGLPFKPYNISTQAPYDFIEVPLNVMDGTLHRYMEIPLKETASSIINFIEKNKNNSVISILWHNTYFTNYKYSGYLEEYKKVLLYLKESEITSITPEEILND